MDARIFTAEASVIAGRAAQNDKRCVDKHAVFDAPGPHIDWGAIGASDHCVLVYDEDAHLLDAVSRFTGTGLEAGEAVVVLATQPHRDYLEARFRAHGVDLATMGARGQYVSLDAAETLSRFMIDGWPDAQRFVDVVGGVVAHAGGRYPRVRAFGEMVALLWAEGNRDAALRIEELWNDLIALHAFPLLCAYPMRGFSRAVHAQKLLTIVRGALPCHPYGGLYGAGQSRRAPAHHRAATAEGARARSRDCGTEET